MARYPKANFCSDLFFLFCCVFDPRCCLLTEKKPVCLIYLQHGMVRRRQRMAQWCWEREIERENEWVWRHQQSKTVRFRRNIFFLFYPFCVLFSLRSSADPLEEFHGHQQDATQNEEAKKETQQKKETISWRQFCELICCPCSGFSISCAACFERKISLYAYHHHDDDETIPKHPPSSKRVFFSVSLLCCSVRLVWCFFLSYHPWTHMIPSSSFPSHFVFMMCLLLVLIIFILFFFGFENETKCMGKKFIFSTSFLKINGWCVGRCLLVGESGRK